MKASLYSIFKNQKKFLLFTVGLSFFLFSKSPETETYNSQNCHKKTNTELPFVIVIASYNNKDWYELNLDSVFMQNYENYRIIYIDDMSPDQTGDLVEKYIENHPLKEKITLIKNKERKLKMENVYLAIHSCDDDEIVMILDGDDWLAHENVLSRINHEYLSADIWITYGSYEDIYEGETPSIRRCANISPAVKNKKDPIKKIIRNSADYIPGHPKTFYAWLFKKIKAEDLYYDGVFAASASDAVMAHPLHEMARGRCAFIPEILYIHNSINPLNDSKVDRNLQKGISTYHRNLPRTYFSLNSPEDTPHKILASSAKLLSLQNWRAQAIARERKK